MIYADSGDSSGYIQMHMGANVTNSMCEAVTPMLEKLTGGRALLRILSNYSTIRLARASAIFRKDLIGGSRIVDDMIRGYEFAQYDEQENITTHKKLSEMA